jgi:hypothetical protein
MAGHGTTWENFSPRRGEESHSHAWSAHPLFHLMQIIGGVVQTAPAWKTIAFRPLFYGTHAQTVIPTPQGPIVSNWRKEGGSILVALKLPRGIKARVSLPGLKPAWVAGNQKWTVAEKAASTGRSGSARAGGANRR